MKTISLDPSKIGHKLTNLAEVNNRIAAIKAEIEREDLPEKQARALQKTREAMGAPFIRYAIANNLTGRMHPKFIAFQMSAMGAECTETQAAKAQGDYFALLNELKQSGAMDGTLTSIRGSMNGKIKESVADTPFGAIVALSQLELVKEAVEALQEKREPVSLLVHDKPDSKDGSLIQYNGRFFRLNLELARRTWRVMGGSMKATGREIKDSILKLLSKEEAPPAPLAIEATVVTVATPKKKKEKKAKVAA